MSEKESIKAQIADIEKQKEPLEERLREIYAEEAADIEEKIKRCNSNKDAFTADELRFSASARCPCGAGLAYPKNIGAHGAWHCSDILLGRAVPSGQEGAKTHDSPLPFAFYEIKSEDQPSANGSTTRPLVTQS